MVAVLALTVNVAQDSADTDGKVDHYRDTQAEVTALADVAAQSACLVEAGDVLRVIAMLDAALTERPKG